jgi:hypothetical protein
MLPEAILLANDWPRRLPDLSYSAVAFLAVMSERAQMDDRGRGSARGVRCHGRRKQGQPVSHPPTQVGLGLATLADQLALDPVHVVLF